MKTTCSTHERLPLSPVTVTANAAPGPSSHRRLFFWVWGGRHISVSSFLPVFLHLRLFFKNVFYVVLRIRLDESIAISLVLALGNIVDWRRSHILVSSSSYSFCFRRDRLTSLTHSHGLFSPCSKRSKSNCVSAHWSISKAPLRYWAWEPRRYKAYNGEAAGWKKNERDVLNDNRDVRDFLRWVSEYFPSTFFFFFVSISKMRWKRPSKQKG